MKRPNPSSFPPRRPAGTPAGGQFAAGSHAEAGNDLTMSEGFTPGGVVMTPGVAELVDESPGGDAELDRLLGRHFAGDWGDVDEDDAAANDAAWRGDGRVISAYTLAGRPVWVITEADRSVTTVLLPDEY